MQKVVNNRVFGGAQTLPLRVDTGGAASNTRFISVVAPATFASFVSADSWLKPYFDTFQQSLYPGKMLFNVVFSLLINIRLFLRTNSIQN